MIRRMVTVMVLVVVGLVGAALPTGSAAQVDRALRGALAAEQGVRVAAPEVTDADFEDPEGDGSND